MEITKREVIMSIAIIAIMFIIGLVISDNIRMHQDEKNAEYQKAVQIDDAELFKYGMKTNVGHAFVYGKLNAVDVVTCKDINGKYLYIKTVEEHYNRHTRRVTSNGKTRTQVYYSWDFHDSWEKHSKQIEFCGVKFDYNKIQIPPDHYLDTIYKSSRVRYHYYVVGTNHKGTIYTSLKNNTISDRSWFYVDADINKALEIETNAWDISVILFWILWIILIAIVVYGFYYLDNWWLE